MIDNVSKFFSFSVDVYGNIWSILDKESEKGDVGKWQESGFP
jgi:hypothetical protein